MSAFFKHPVVSAYVHCAKQSKILINPKSISKGFCLVSRNKSGTFSQILGYGHRKILWEAWQSWQCWIECSKIPPQMDWPKKRMGSIRDSYLLAPTFRFCHKTLYKIRILKVRFFGKMYAHFDPFLPFYVYNLFLHFKGIYLDNFLILLVYFCSFCPNGFWPIF